MGGGEGKKNEGTQGGIPAFLHAFWSDFIIWGTNSNICLHLATIYFGLIYHTLLKPSLYSIHFLSNLGLNFCNQSGSCEKLLSCNDLNKFAKVTKL